MLPVAAKGDVGNSNTYYTMYHSGSSLGEVSGSAQINNWGGTCTVYTDDTKTTQVSGCSFSIQQNVGMYDSASDFIWTQAVWYVCTTCTNAYFQPNFEVYQSSSCGSTTPCTNVVGTAYDFTSPLTDYSFWSDVYTSGSEIIANFTATYTPTDTTVLSWNHAYSSSFSGLYTTNTYIVAVGIGGGQYTEFASGTDFSMNNYVSTTWSECVFSTCTPWYNTLTGEGSDLSYSGVASGTYNLSYALDY